MDWLLLKPMDQELEKSNLTDTKWEWLPKHHLYHLIGFNSFSVLILLLFSFPFFGENDLFWTVIFFAQLVSIWQTNISATQATKRAFHLHSRAIYALCLAIGIKLRAYFLYDNIELDLFLYQFLMLWIISGIASLIIFYIPFKFFNDSKYYIIRFTRYFIPLAVLFIAFLIGIEEGWFNAHKGEKIKWDDTRDMSFDDFRGYPDLFSKYAATIHSQIEFEFDSEDQLLTIDAVCHLDETWVNPWDKDSYPLLQHEVYHFNITEMVTRMARKAVFEAINKGLEKVDIKEIIAQHQAILRTKQVKYDKETNHSLIPSMQSLWQFKIDSTLGDLDSYWTSAIFEQVANSENDTLCYRNLLVNDKNKLVGTNVLMPNEEKYTQHYKFIYHKNKSLKKIVAYSLGKIATGNYFEVAIIKIDNKTNGDVAWAFYDVNDQPVLCNKGYHRKTIANVGNQLVQMNYFDKDGEPTKHKQGQFATQMNLDTFGRMIDQKYVDAKGDQLTNNQGFYHRKFEYKGKMNFSYTDKNYNSKNKPLLDNEGMFQRFYSYNNNGQIASFWAKDIAGKYVDKEGYALVQYQYNELGMYISATLMNQKKELLEDKNGIAKYEFIEDRYGNIARRTYYNSNDVLTENSDGNAMVFKTYDQFNNLTALANYDTGGLLTFDENTYGKVQYKYDHKNRRKEIINKNAYGDPFNTATAGPIELLEYDSLDRISKGTFVDAFHLLDTSSLGVSYYTLRYDKNGNTIELKQYGINNQLINVHDGVSIYRYSYDKNKNKTKTSYYSKDDLPAFANQGAFINTYKYSADNNLIQRAYYDTTYQLIEFDGYAKIQWKYDQRANVLEKKYFNKDDALVKAGTAIISQAFNSSNLLTEQCEYDFKGNGIIKRKYTYDQIGNEIAVTNFTIDDQPIGNDNKVHQYLYKYKEKSFMGERYLDSLGNLMELENGVAEVQITRDSRANASVRKTVNKKKELVIDTDRGYAIVHYEYDLYDRIVSEAYFDTNEKLMLINGHYAIVKYSRDNSGNILEKYFYNKFDNLTEDQDSVALYRYEFNRNGALIDSEEFNLEKAKNQVNEHLR
jgi:hypothetical protein